MMTALSDPALRVRLLVAGVLAVCALLLSAAGTGTGSPGVRGTEAERRSAESGIAAALDSLMAEDGITAADVRTWRATAAGKPTGRIEQRVTVGRAFLSLDFNHGLGIRVAQFGARVVGTEKTREQIVAMHIIRGGRTIRTVSFVTDAGR